MLTKQIIKPAKSAPAVGPYNHAVRVGDLLFCAGQIPLDPTTGNLVEGDIKAQTERVLDNVKTILDDQKLTFANVVKSTVFL
ncbi:MAG: Rid family hydrolase, partial [Verrucomicrobiota bacterium]